MLAGFMAKKKEEKKITCVVPLHSSNGSLIVVSHVQSLVFHTFTERSSLCDAKYFPTYSILKISFLRRVQDI